MGSDIRVYPNPSRGKVKVVYKGGVSNLLTLEVFDIMGRRCLRREMRGYRGGEEIRLDLDCLPSGRYFLRMNLGNRVKTIPLLVVR